MLIVLLSIYLFMFTYEFDNQNIFVNNHKHQLLYLVRIDRQSIKIKSVNDLKLYNYQ
jgi:hypothetical protein